LRAYCFPSFHHINLKCHFDALYKDQGESDVIGELENEFQADERDEIVLFKFDGQVLTSFCRKLFAPCTFFRKSIT
jgi:hypothetical protein